MSAHHRWLGANAVTWLELHVATSLLSNPGGTRPTGRAIRKMIAMLRRGDKPLARGGYPSWRDTPRAKFVGEPDTL